MNDWVPAPCTLSDKLSDWLVLAEAGGDALIRDRDVLDVGPAWGVDAFAHCFYAKRYDVLDSSEAVLAHLRACMPPEVIIHEGDLTQRWPFPDAMFDTVIDFSSLDDSIDAMAGYTQALRVLRTGGVLVSTFGNADVIPDRRSSYVTHHPDALASELHRMGFEVKRLLNQTQARAGIVTVKR